MSSILVGATKILKIIRLDSMYNGNSQITSKIYIDEN